MVILSSHWGILVRNREHPTRPALMHYTIYETHVNTTLEYLIDGPPRLLDFDFFCRPPRAYSNPPAN